MERGLNAPLAAPAGTFPEHWPWKASLPHPLLKAPKVRRGWTLLPGGSGEELRGCAITATIRMRKSGPPECWQMVQGITFSSESSFEIWRNCHRPAAMSVPADHHSPCHLSGERSTVICRLRNRKSHYSFKMQTYLGYPLNDAHGINYFGMTLFN